MKPITDDIVRSILAGVEKRETEKLKKDLRKKVYRKKLLSSDIAHHARQRVSGVFSYVTRQKPSGSEPLRPQNFRI